MLHNKIKGNIYYLMRLSKRQFELLRGMIFNQGLLPEIPACLLRQPKNLTNFAYCQLLVDVFLATLATYVATSFTVISFSAIYFFTSIFNWENSFTSACDGLELELAFFVGCPVSPGPALTSLAPSLLSKNT